MPVTDIATAVLPNGLTVVVESMPTVQSAAYTLLIPAGSAWDAPGQSGIGSVLCDWLTRGAGELANRAYAEAVDRLGIQHSETVSASHLTLSGTCLSDHLAGALELLADQVARPAFDEAEFEPSVTSVVHELQALDDDPRQRVMLELVRRCYPTPWNQPPEGSLADLEGLTPAAVRSRWNATIRPNQAILGIAGKVTMASVQPAVERAFERWQAGTVTRPVAGPRGEQVAHLPAASAQTQIGVSYPAVPYRSPDYYAAWAVVSVLSGGMSSRLFTEVREKRGLCYSVYATLSTLRETGSVLCYCGTAPERAQESLDVLLGELVRLREGVSLEELRRAEALAKSSLVMAQESSSSRAGSLARDWYHLDRVVPVDEVQAAIAALTPETLVDYVRRHPATDGTVVTIGPAPLTVNWPSVG